MEGLIARKKCFYVNLGFIGRNQSSRIQLQFTRGLDYKIVKTSKDQFRKIHLNLKKKALKLFIVFFTGNEDRGR
jgi:hypothetical protein